jgi:alkylglycerol monooxygenase
MTIQADIVLGVLIGIYLLLLLLEFMLSGILRKNYASGEYTVINLSLALMQQSTGVLHTAIFVGGFVYVQQNWSIQQWLQIPSIEARWPIGFSGVFPFIHFDIPMVMAWSLVIVLADFCQYWLHRLSHEVNILWAGHVVHHSNTEYNFSVALRQSFIEGFYTWVFYLPLAFLGVPWQLFISAYAISLLWQFLAHTRFIGKMGLLEKFMATPSHHRVHHGRNKAYLDKNYGAFLIIWDKLFGTFNEETEAPDYGITVPLQRNNLFWVNIHQHVHIWNNLKLAGSWRDRFRSLFGLPSFVPAGVAPPLAGPDLRPVIRQKEKKTYVFASFLLTAVTGIWLIQYFSDAGQSIFYLLIAVLMMGSFTTICSLLEDDPKADRMEVVRLFVFVLLGLYLAMTGEVSMVGWLIVLWAVSLLLSTIWVASRYRQSQIITQA